MVRLESHGGELDQGHCGGDFGRRMLGWTLAVERSERSPCVKASSAATRETMGSEANVTDYTLIRDVWNEDISITGTNACNRYDYK